MRVATITPITCPRCDVPVQGDYKFCPACAFRLRPGTPPAEERAPHTGLHWWVLLALAGAGLLAAGYLVGVRIFGERKAPVYAPDPEPEPLTSTDILEHLVLIPSGTATYVGESVYWVPPVDTAVQRLFTDFAGDGGPELIDSILEQPQGLGRWSRLLSTFHSRTADLVEERLLSVPVVTETFLMMAYEVSRGQYAEFLRAVQADPGSLATREAFVLSLWRPSADLGYAQYYWEQWWLQVAETDRLRRHQAWMDREARRPEDAEPEAPPPDRERPAWLSADGISDEQGVLLLVPPSWVRIDEDGSYSWSLEPGTEDLPVTGISWWDAHMFVLWARDVLGVGTIDLPNTAQWMRAFHGNHPLKPADDFVETEIPGWRWPWGNVADPGGCNNLNFPLNEVNPILRNVRRRYGWHEGRTEEGVLNMAGNAAEWVDNLDPARLGGHTEGPYRALTNEYLPDGRFIQSAYVAGGSYLSGIVDCGLPLNATLHKCARASHVGFRLLLRPGPAR